jgi:hypothetical protein
MLRILLLVTLMLPTAAEAARPAGCPNKWCGCWLGIYTGKTSRDLWRAKNWQGVGHRASGPGVGVIVVWRNHVGIITRREGDAWVVKSGNDSRQVRERVWPLRSVVAYRVINGPAPIQIASVSPPRWEYDR